MTSVARFIALSLFVALAISATTGTFAGITAFSATGASSSARTNGYVVALTAAGWAYGDALTLSSTATSVTYTTLTASSGLTGVGLATVGGATCTTTPTATSSFTTASLIGKGTVGNPSATPATTTPACPVDFATLYTASPGASTSNAATVTTFSATTNYLPLNNAVKWIITTPASAGCIGLAISYQTNTGSLATPTPATAGACTGTAATTLQVAQTTNTFAFYVETATSATVCFQNQAQYDAAAGNCGTVITSSAGILSATISGFVAMIALIFFN